jgi:hypothetical protein
VLLKVCLRLNYVLLKSWFVKWEWDLNVRDWWAQLPVQGRGSCDRLSVLKVPSGMSVGLRMSQLYMLFVQSHFMKQSLGRLGNCSPIEARQLTERIAEVCSYVVRVRIRFKQPVRSPQKGTSRQPKRLAIATSCNTKLRTFVSFIIKRILLARYLGALLQLPHQVMPCAQITVLRHMTCRPNFRRVYPFWQAQSLMLS